MDTRNYDEPADCGLGSCDCREDNTCGCSYPNNMAEFFNLENQKDPNGCTCGDFFIEKLKQGEEQQEKTLGLDKNRQ